MYVCMYVHLYSMLLVWGETDNMYICMCIVLLLQDYEESNLGQMQGERDVLCYIEELPLDSVFAGFPHF